MQDPPTESPRLRVHFLDVGYADCILVEFPDGSNLLIDGGDKGAEEKIVGLLDRRRIRRIDTVIITHPHVNHFGGFFKLMEEFPIGQVFTNGHSSEEDGYTDLLGIFGQKNIPIARLKRGDLVPLASSNVSLEVLHPPDKDLSGDRNRHSLVLKLIHGKTSVLFTGDIDETSQKDLAEVFGVRLNADCIQVPHHGLPISKIFLERFKAPLYIISTGPSQWGLPSQEELDRLPGKTLRTDQEGDIVIKMDGRQLKVAAKE